MQKPIKKQQIRIDGADIVSANILRVTVGTNGLHGGDANHGSETFFRLENMASSCMECLAFKNGVEIHLQGDTELHTLINALEYAALTLRAKSGITDHQVEFEYLEGCQ